MVLSDHYLDPGFEPGSPSAASCGDRVTIPLGHRVGIYKKGTEKIRREPPLFEFGGEVTLMRFSIL